ncbi:hypothetical protein F5Y16DRAFT_239457 [Xylariaceae sp. FL0255]|nr:hypothetical protein F5Y16DRAFT_239457 [Xylariaceae sp. FL0255]
MYLWLSISLLLFLSSVDYSTGRLSHLLICMMRCIRIRQVDTLKHVGMHLFCSPTPFMMQPGHIPMGEPDKGNFGVLSQSRCANKYTVSSARHVFIDK